MKYVGTVGHEGKPFFSDAIGTAKWTENVIKIRHVCTMYAYM